MEGRGVTRHGRLTGFIQRAEGLLQRHGRVARDSDQDDNVPDVEGKRRKLAAECPRPELSAEAEVVEYTQTQLQIGVSDELVVMRVFRIVDGHFENPNYLHDPLVRESCHAR